MSRRADYAAALFLACLCSFAPAQVILTLTPSADGTLYQDATGALANGAGSLLFSGLNAGGVTRRGILGFDLTQVPPGSFVCAVSLQMTAIATTNNSVVAMGLHPVMSAWGEGASVATGGQGGGAPAQAGDATWLHTFVPATFWSSAGGDMSTVASASTNVSTPGTYTWTGTGALVLDVQGWVDSPSSNHGWVLRSPESTSQSMKHFGTRESSTVANRPQLTVTFLPGVSASVTPIGPACSAAPASMLMLSISGLPTIPNPTFAFQVAGGPPAGGASIFLSPGLASPPVGLPNNCFVLLDLTGVFDMIAAGVSPLGPLSLDQTGSVSLAIPIPFVPCIGGAQVAAQAISVDPQFGGGFALSNAIALVLGH